MSMTMEEMKKEAETCNEVMLYFMIDTMGGFIWDMNHEMSHGRVEASKGIHDDIADTRKRLEYAVDQTARFGVEAPVRDEKGKANDSYWRWFRYWDAWKEKMNNKEWDKFNGEFPKGEYEAMLPDPDGWKEKPDDNASERAG